MGYARIFWIYEDDLRHMKGDEDASAIGRRVLELFERGRFGYDNVNLPSSSPEVCQAGMSNSSENGVYI